MIEERQITRASELVQLEIKRVERKQGELSADLRKQEREAVSAKERLLQTLRNGTRISRPTSECFSRLLATISHEKKQQAVRNEKRSKIEHALQHEAKAYSVLSHRYDFLTKKKLEQRGIKSELHQMIETCEKVAAIQCRVVQRPHIVEKSEAKTPSELSFSSELESPGYEIAEPPAEAAISHELLRYDEWRGGGDTCFGEQHQHSLPYASPFHHEGSGSGENTFDTPLQEQEDNALKEKQEEAGTYQGFHLWDEKGEKGVEFSFTSVKKESYRVRLVRGEANTLSVSISDVDASLSQADTLALKQSLTRLLQSSGLELHTIQIER